MQGRAVESRVQETRRKLKKAGFKAEDLEAMTELIAGMEERLATKEDLAKTERVLTQDIAKVRTELKQDVAEVKEDLSQLKVTVARNAARIESIERAMEALRQEIRDRFESFRQEIAAQLAGMQGQITGIEGRITGMQGQIDGLRGELRMVKWILGGMFALMVPMLGGIIGIALQLAQL